MIEFNDALSLLHPAIAVLFVFPLIGIVLNLAWQTRQRRLQNAAGGKSKIPPVVGPEHNRLGHWLTGSVVGLTLVGIGYPIFKNIFNNGTGAFCNTANCHELGLHIGWESRVW